MSNSKEYNKKYYSANKDATRERRNKSQAVWQSKNKEYIKEWALQNKDRLKNYRRDYNLKKKYGISLEEYNKLLETQNGGCAICCTEEAGHSSNNFVVDHDHITNKIRGLLCHKCNVMLGYSCDNTQTLLNAVKYLEK